MRPPPRRGHHIPYPRRDVVEMLRAGGIVPAAREQAFRDAGRMLSAVMHFEVHHVVERLKELHRSCSPDADVARPPPDGHGADSADMFIAAFEALLSRANFALLSRTEVEEAYRSTAVVNIAVKVRHDDFAVERFHVRGPAVHFRTARSWGGLRRRRVAFEVYDRVALIIRYKGPEHFAATGHKLPPFTPGTVAIKLFKSVPKADLEVLYPSSDVSMRLVDRLVLGIPTVVGGVPLLGKLGGALAVLLGVIAGVLGYEGITDEDRLKQAMASLTAAVALASFAFQRWVSYQNRRNAFHRELARNLYFRTVANDTAALFSVADAAEEEDVKEMLVALGFLLASPEGVAPEHLNHAVESWFRDAHGCELVFECREAVHNLVRLGLARPLPDGHIAPVDLPAALAVLDAIWDGYFRFPQPAASAHRIPCPPQA